VGVDPSAEMLAQLAARGTSVRAQRGPAERLELPDESFDFVYSVDVLHHIRDRAAAFSEAARVLRPGGRVCTATDSEQQIRRREILKRYFPEALEVELARYPRLELVEYEMLRAGFDVTAEEELELSSQVTDATPFKNKAYSYLLYLSDAAFARGLAELEADLQRGPVPYVSRYVMLWGYRPA
jgi:ubiquinone/menaquinone biosynthesis C-methylase UbiE